MFGIRGALRTAPDPEVSQMIADQIDPRTIRYDAAEGAFQALVPVHAAGTTTRHAVSLPAPLDTPLSEIARSLRAAALAQAAAGRGLRSHRDEGQPRGPLFLAPDAPPRRALPFSFSLNRAA